jgi:anti-sigma B factor antagonist
VTLAGTTTETRILALGGEMDGWPTRIEEELGRLGGRPARLVLDLTAADGIDATALGTFVLAQMRLERDGGELALICEHPEARNLLERTGLNRVFEVMPARR